MAKTPRRALLALLVSGANATRALGQTYLRGVVESRHASHGGFVHVHPQVFHQVVDDSVVCENVRIGPVRAVADVKNKATSSCEHSIFKRGKEAGSEVLSPNTGKNRGDRKGGCISLRFLPKDGGCRPNRCNFGD